jgi:hypothetical protein
MWPRGRAFVIATVSFAMALSTASPAEAGNRCPYWIIVVRQERPGEQEARVCYIGSVVDWMRATSEANISPQPPQVVLNSGFTITIYTARRARGFEGLPLEPWRQVLLTEHVYPVAESGPVAFVASRSIFHGPGQYPRWVVRAGWRYLDPMDRVPTVLTKLGMLQPIAPGPTPTPTATAPAPTTGSSRPGPDLVTLLFLVAILVSVGVAVRRSIGRTRPQIPDGLGSHSEPSHR